MLDRARPVDDPKPHDGEPEPLARGLNRQRLLAVDLREVREIALRSVGRLRPDVARQPAAVDVQRRAEDEQRHPRLADRASHSARSRHVRLLRVVRVALRERPRGLGRQQVDDVGSPCKQAPEVLADVCGLDASAGRGEPVEL